jgi:hypothetical protein
LETKCRVRDEGYSRWARRLREARYTALKAGEVIVDQRGVLGRVALGVVGGRDDVAGLRREEGEPFLQAPLVEQHCFPVEEALDLELQRVGGGAH